MVCLTRINEPEFIPARDIRIKVKNIRRNLPFLLSSQSDRTVSSHQKVAFRNLVQSFECRRHMKLRISGNRPGHDRNILQMTVQKSHSGRLLIQNSINGLAGHRTDLR